MSAAGKTKPWDFLQAFKGEFFTGEWPTVPEMFSISAKRYPETDVSPSTNLMRR